MTRAAWRGGWCSRAANREDGVRCDERVRWPNRSRLNHDERRSQPGQPQLPWARVFPSVRAQARKTLDFSHAGGAGVGHSEPYRRKARATDFGWL